MSNFDINDRPKQNLTDKVKYAFDKITVSQLKNGTSNPGLNNSLLSATINIPTSQKYDFFFEKGSSQHKYKANTIYFYPLLHNNITDKTDGTHGSEIDGEIVIELSGVEGTTGEAYACFFAKFNNNHIFSDVDVFKHLIDMPGSGGNTINLDTSIPSQDFCIYYRANPLNTSGNPVTTTLVDVFVFSTPISINRDTQSLFVNSETTSSGTRLFSVDAPTNYEIVVRNIGTINDDQIYIDCNLTGESQETVASYNIPVNSAFSDSIGESNYMKMTVNFGIFTIALFFTYFTVPVLYKMTVIDRINVVFQADSREKTKRMVGTDVLIFMVVIGIAMYLFLYGMAKENYKIQTAAMGVTVIYILSYCILQIKKNDDKYRTTHTKNGDLLIENSRFAFSISEIATIFPILIDWFWKILINSIYILAVLIVFLIIDVLLYWYSVIDFITFVELITFGSFGVTIVTIIGIAIFTKIQRTFEYQKVTNKA